MNRLIFGDNLPMLRDCVANESVDLVYLDPPFKSNQDYNVLFAEKDGTKAAAQIQAFKDTWEWNQEAAKAYEEVVEGGGQVSLVMQAFHTFLGGSDMLAYLAMMGPRLVELQRVLKPTGSIYLHCDPTASHYLKLLMDAVFGPAHFLSEIIWKRTSAHSSAQRYGPVHDVILFYAKTDDYLWKPQCQPYDADYLETFFDQEDPDGRRWKRCDLTGAGIRHGETGLPWRGIDVTAKGRHWAVPPDRLDALDKKGRIHWPQKKKGMPRAKQYPEDLPGVPLQDVWTDIRPLHNLSPERLGYPTQKPQALLERILLSSTNEGDMVLDPFCGCGTAVAAAQKLNRRWTGIDITSLAIMLIRQRLRDAYPNCDIDKTYELIGVPKTVQDAVMLAAEQPYQFQFWALDLVGARPADEKKGADRGIDGRLFFHDESKGGKTKQIIISVKGGQHIAAQFVRDLEGVITREKAQIGVLISMHPFTKAMRKEAASAGFYHSPWGSQHPKIQLLTIEDLLAGKRIDYPAANQTSVTFKKAPQTHLPAPEQKPLLS